LLVLLF